jgi:hypothetical protein
MFIETDIPGFMIVVPPPPGTAAAYAEWKRENARWIERLRKLAPA